MEYNDEQGADSLGIFEACVLDDSHEGGGDGHAEYSQAPEPMHRHVPGLSPVVEYRAQVHEESQQELK